MYPYVVNQTFNYQIYCPLLWSIYIVIPWLEKIKRVFLFLSTSFCLLDIVHSVLFIIRLRRICTILMALFLTNCDWLEGRCKSYGSCVLFDFAWGLGCGILISPKVEQIKPRKFLIRITRQQKYDNIYRAWF